MVALISPTVDKIALVQLLKKDVMFLPCVKYLALLSLECWQ